MRVVWVQVENAEVETGIRVGGRKGSLAASGGALHTTCYVWAVGPPKISAVSGGCLFPTNHVAGT